MNWLDSLLFNDYSDVTEAVLSLSLPLKFQWLLYVPPRLEFNKIGNVCVT
jgi:hypothetical protein